MQKKLIALAVAGMFAAPAFAATSNVDVYGQINMSVESVNDGDDRWARMVSNNNSFFGFKGSEDLGGGLSAVWQIEMNLNTDGNVGSDWSDAGAISGTRNTFVGLSSKNFGTVLAGVHDTPYKMATGPLDLFVGTLGEYNAIMGAAASNPSSTFDLRTGNTIAYISPDFSGFNFKAAYVMGYEGNLSGSGDDTSNVYSLSGTYSNGPLFVTAAYEKHNDVDTVSCRHGAVCLGAGEGYDRDAWKIGGSYKFGDLKVGAMYENMDDNADSIGHYSWMLNAAYTMGAMTFKAEYLKASELDAVNDSGASMWALGMDYALSKRTTIQLTYARLDNDDNGNWDLGQGPRVTNDSAGDTVSGFGLGVRHSF